MTAENVFRLLGTALVVISFAISAFYRRRASQSREQISATEEGSPILLLRSVFGLAMLFGMLVYFLNPAWMSWAQLPLPDWMRWLGVGIMTVSLPLFYWIFSSLDRYITHTVVTRQQHELITHGPYSRVSFLCWSEFIISELVYPGEHADYIWDSAGAHTHRGGEAD